MPIAEKEFEWYNIPLQNHPPQKVESPEKKLPKNVLLLENIEHFKNSHPEKSLKFDKIILPENAQVNKYKGASTSWGRSFGRGKILIELPGRVFVEGGQIWQTFRMQGGLFSAYFKGVFDRKTICVEKQGILFCIFPLSMPSAIAMRLLSKGANPRIHLIFEAYHSGGSNS